MGIENANRKLAGLSEGEQRALLAELLRKQGSKSRIAPLSFAQERMWFLDQLQTGTSVRNILNAARLLGELDVAALERGFQAVVQRHESLRTTFGSADGQPHQVIARDMVVKLPVVDISERDAAEQEAEIMRLVRDESERPFDLAMGPLVRCQLLRLADDEHVLLVAMHHIISDGWSMGVFFHEIMMFAQSSLEGESADPLPLLPLQYADFALWQRNWLQGDVLEGQLQYWKEQLKDVPDILDLPTDLARPDVQAHRGARQYFKLGRELSAELQAFSRREDGTLFMILLAAFDAMLWCYSGQQDFVVGSPVANRNRAELEGLIGFFANTLVLRARISDDMPFRGLLQEVQETCLGAYDHQDFPFDRLVDELRVERDLSRNPLFQVMFALQNVPMDITGSSGLRVEPLEVEVNMAHFDLRMSLQDKNGELGGFIEYNAGLFEVQTIDLLVGLYRQILAGWVANPDQSLDDIAMSTALSARVTAARVRNQRRKIVVAATFTAEPVEDTLGFWMSELGLPAMIEFAPYNQVFQELLDPHSLLLNNVDGFGMLLLRWEDWLRDNESADPEMLLLRNLADLERALLGAGEQDMAPLLVLVCPASPQELAVAGRRELYQRLEQRLRESLASGGKVYLLQSAELLRYYPVGEYYDAHTDELGHIPYTPAMYTAIGTFLARKMHAWRMTPYKVIVLDCDQTLWAGVCGEDGAQGIELDAGHLALQAFMREQRGMGKLLCLCSKNEEEDVWKVFEQRSDMLLKREDLVGWRINWQAKSENLRSLARELNLGLESFIFVDDNPLECAEVRAGCPQVYVLELPANATELPQLLDREWVFDQLKVTGEDRKRTQLYQENKARERLKTETLTYEEFIEGLELQIEIAPPQTGQIERLSQLTLRTNQFNTTTIRRSETEVQDKKSCVVDVRDRFGAYGLVGAFFYESRRDALHVDSFLLSCRALGRGVAERMLAWLGSEAQRLGLLYVDMLYVPSARNQPALEFLEAVGKEYQRAEATASVFHYPAEVCAHLSGLVSARAGSGELETLARTGNEAERLLPIKPVRRELHEVAAIEQAVRAWKPGRVRGPGDYVAPLTDTEQTLVGIWMQVLNLQQIGIHDNFFDLGGHSLLITQVISRIRNTCRVELPFDALFKRQTIAEIAGYLDELRHVEEPLLLPAARPAQIPLSFAQQRLWFMDQMAAGNVAYNIFNSLRLHGSLDVAALARGFRQVVQRHESLRTSFLAVDGQPYQSIAPNLDVTLQMLDISMLVDTERESEAQRLTREEGRRPFDLSRAPLVRCTLLKMAEDDHVLLLNMHHIVSDGWSMGIFFRELMAFAQSDLDGESGALKPLPMQYADFALWQRNWLQGEELARQIGYWKEQLGDAPDRLALPADHARPEIQTYRGGRLYFKLDKELSEGLHALSRREDTTLFMLLLAGFDALLWRYSGQTDIVVGSPVANRNRAELEGLIGFFANNLVLRARLSGGMRLSELLLQTKEICLRAYQHQDLPFEKLVDELRLKRDLSRNPLFQVMFILQNTPREDLAVSGLRVEPLEVEPDVAQFDLRMSLRDMPDGLSGYLEYNTDLFDAETIGLLADLYEHILMSWVDETQQALREIEVPAALLARVQAAQAREQRQGTRVRRELGDVAAIEQAVRAWKPGQVRALAEYAAPRTPMERTLVEIWKQLLNLEQVGIHDNFFDLGGHSLLITQVISRIRSTCQVELPFDVLFERQTIAEIAEYMDGVRIAQHLKTSPGSAQVDRDEGEL